MLDTSIVIDALKGDAGYEHGKISVLTLLEFLRGIPPEKRAPAKALLEEAYDVVGIGNRAVLEYCGLYESLKTRGEALPDADLLIGATALALGEPLMTKDLGMKRLKEQGVNIVMK